MKILCAFLSAISINLSIAQNSADFITPDPDSALILYNDIANFWKAFDRIEKEGSRVFERYYIGPGSNGVKHFLDHNRIVNADTLYNTVLRRKSDYLRIREQTLRMAEAALQCRAAYYAFKY